MKPCDFARSNVVSAKAMRLAPTVAMPTAANLTSTSRRDIPVSLDITSSLLCWTGINPPLAMMYTTMLDFTQVSCRFALPWRIEGHSCAHDGRNDGRGGDLYQAVRTRRVCRP